MAQRCDYCVNKTQCAECKSGWRDKFIPSDEIRKYFRKGYMGGGKSYYYFDTSNENLVPTHIIWIGNTAYCPYCGNKMFPIQDNDCRITGYTCICEGARSEIEYEEKLKALAEKHRQEIAELNREYADKLVFCADKLLEIKHEEEKHHLEFLGSKCTHMSTLNGERYTDIDQIVR